MKKRIVFFSGAGISAESGIPTFRNPGGLWDKFKPEDFATLEAFHKDPKKVWKWYDERRMLMKKAQPNEAHKLIAQLETKLKDKAEIIVITQNIDELHQRAGSSKVIELHGNIWTIRCTVCGYKEKNYDTPLKELPPKCTKCGALARPDVVWFGEMLPQDAWEEAVMYSSTCDVFVSIGTSAQVYPAAYLPHIAKEKGAYLVEINIEETELTPFVDRFIRKKASEGMKEFADMLLGMV